MPLLRLEGEVLGMNVGSDTRPDITMVQPDPAMIALYADVVFGYCEGWVPVRALAEKGARRRRRRTRRSSRRTASSPRAWRCRPAGRPTPAWRSSWCPARSRTPGEARAEHVAQTQVVLVDLDHGDIAAKRAHLLRHLGTPTLEVASGGVTAGRASASSTSTGG